MARPHLMRDRPSADCDSCRFQAGRQGALRDLAKGYLSWLDERVGRARGRSHNGIESLQTWHGLPGVGRRHFAHRAGVPFK